MKRKIERCDWRCPKCNSRCSGVKNHKGVHQCPIHYKPKKRESGNL